MDRAWRLRWLRRKKTALEARDRPTLDRLEAEWDARQRQAKPKRLGLWLVGLVLGLVACAPPEHFAATCAAPGISLVDSEVPVDCAIVAANVAIAREQMIATGAIPADAWDATFAATRVVIREADARITETAWAEYSPDTDTIFLNRHMVGLAHEMGHRTEHAERGDADGAHADPGWREGGAYRRASINYDARREEM